MCQTCPVCYTNPVLQPNKVCAACFEMTKNNYVHSRAYWEEELKNFGATWTPERWTGPGPCPTTREEILEQHVKFYMGEEEEKWAKVVGDGLCASQVISDILDGIDATREFHRRRIRFMAELAQRLPVSYFAPATAAQVTDYVQSAVEFWNGEIPRVEANRIYENMKRLLPKNRLSDWASGEFLLWMLQTEEQFDWMWDQWFECIRVCIPSQPFDSIWTELMQKHFASEIRAEVEAYTEQQLGSEGVESKG